MIETITQEISDEIKNWIRTRKKLIADIGKTLLIIIGGLSCAFPHSAWDIFLKIANWQGAIIIRLANWRFVIYKFYPMVRNEWKKEMKVQMLYGIELNKIAKYIIDNGTFKRDEVVRKFGVSRQVAQDMIDKLDEVEVFIRGNNNQRIMDINLSQEDIINRLTISPTQEEYEEENINEELAETSEANDLTDSEQTESEDMANIEGFTRRPLANS